MMVVPVVVSVRNVANFRRERIGQIVRVITRDISAIAADPRLAETVLESRRTLWPVELGQLRRYGDLLWFLALRDVQVRYKQTLLGAGWAILRPLVSMVVFTLLIGKVLGVAEMDDPVFVFAGVLPWTFFAAYVAAATGSLVANAALVQKVYFPRLLLPVSAAGAPMVDLLMGLGVLAVMMPLMGVGFGPQMLLLIPLVLALILAALAIGIALAAVTAFYRDVRHAVPFIIQMLFFLTPVLYPKTLIPASWRWCYLLNPMTGPIEGFRAAVLGTPIDYVAIGSSLCISAVCLIVSLLLFGAMERKLADVL